VIGVNTKWLGSTRKDIVKFVRLKLITLNAKFTREQNSVLLNVYKLIKRGKMKEETKLASNRCEELRIAVTEFHQEHPEIWVLFCKFALEKIDQGHEYYGAKSVMERVRWETPAGGKAPKINNNFVSFYSRRFAEAFPEHINFFRTRIQTSQSSPPRGKPDEPAGGWVS